MRRMQLSGFAARQRVLRSIAASAIVLSAFAPTPAHAATVKVAFGLAAGTYAPTGAACSLNVPAGADGVVVLDAAVTKRCITSYRKHIDPTYGVFIECIDEVCGDAASGFYLTYWSMYVNGVASSYGVSDFRATDGKDLTFSYTTWAPCVAPTGCLP